MDAHGSRNLDPVGVALTQNRLDHISRQMGWVMTRTARSPVFSVGHDFTCFITDADGMVVSQADGIPIHSGGGGFAVRAVLRAFAEEIADGDVFLVSDPYLGGGNHLPDWLVTRPVFVGGQIVAFACNRAHQSDIGGGGAGSYNPNATEIFHEGIRLTPLRLVEAGRIRKDLWSLLLANSRTPELLDGDLRSMLGSVGVGVDRLSALVLELGLDRAKEFIAAVLDHADRRMRAAVLALPDGVYYGEDVSNNDCFETVDVPIRVAITVAGDRLTADFHGTAPQIRGFKNSSLANTHSAVYVALSTFFGHEIPRNEGTFRCATVLAPEGTVVNPRPPAPMTMCTSFVAHEIIHACWKALGQADPARSIAGWGKQTVPITAGHTRENKPYVMFHWNELPGAGAVAGRDGFNEIGPMITLGGLSLSNVETYERLYPVRIWRESFREDGGGPGKFRGGTGVDYVVDVQGPSITSFRGEGLHTPSGFGAAGGRDGQPGVMSLHVGDIVLSAPQFDVREFASFRMTASSPGGGGWGDPLERDPALVLRDVRDGVVSRVAARTEYGVVLAEDAPRIDAEATRRLREQARALAASTERAAE